MGIGSIRSDVSYEATGYSSADPWDYDKSAIELTGDRCSPINGCNKKTVSAQSAPVSNKLHQWTMQSSEDNMNCKQNIICAFVYFLQEVTIVTMSYNLLQQFVTISYLKMHSLIPDISIARLQRHYYPEALPTTASSSFS